MDAINYTKRCGDVDVAFNVFFDRANGGEDYYNTWNINADYSTKGHDLYLGFYYNANDRLGISADHDNSMRVELGAAGKLSNNNEKVKYDLGLVYSKIENAKAGTAAGTFDDETGILAHVAVKYDDQKQLKARLAYTFADDESNSVVNVENSNRYHDGDETIFEDIYLSQMARGVPANNRQSFKNLNDLKLEVIYTLKNNDKHSFRLAYDNITNKDDNKPNTFSMNAGGQYDTDLKANIITFEYTYKLAENTRLRLGYQNSSIEGKTYMGAGVADYNPGDIDSNLYYTEIYSRF
jgi:hypothetical protein